MKHCRFILLIFCTLTMVLYSCNEGPEVGDEDNLVKVREEILSILIANTWEPSKVTREGKDITGDFEGLQIKIQEGTYQSINGGQAWPESGTWQFLEGQSDQLLRDDDVVMTLEIIDDAIKISFTIEEEIFVGGRSKTVQALFSFFLK